ncbi:hypothetical protein QQS21_012808 [Conoideocrella luteorostrata]|uniref:Major facilitator superfamily (MFS) profile domain-containing protein n=1 Tax=Conoideocrella luteorostrata TaxID=1105319 RepID=A0AAJ0FUH2_9HYPO|nr:hypothetical protein QQS21_012808 [Conoideocrella luteorostrata]
MATQMPPGTVRLTGGPDEKIILHPKPTDDYDDPLNWSTRRKTLHFGIVVIYVCMTFFLVDMPQVAIPYLQRDLFISDEELSLGRTLNFVGLGLGGICLIPLAYRYGRRPIYLLSALIQVPAAIWLGNVTSKYEFFVSSFLVSFGAAVTQTLVPMTITDMFFIHQFATMNGWFLFSQGTGSFLGQVVTGFIVQNHGWRWAWRCAAILLSFTFFVMLFMLEESTFVPLAPNEDGKVHDEELFFNRPFSYGSTTDGHDPIDLVDINRTMAAPAQAQADTQTPSLPPRPKTLRQRFALVTATKRPIQRRFLAPFVILCTFPAVAYAAVTYGATMAWLTMCYHVAARKLVATPYNFNSRDMGLFGLAPFIGHTIGSLAIPALSDIWIVKLARQNGGIYHPEMRLRLAIPAGVVTWAGILFFGLAAANDAPWIVLAVSFGIFGFGFAICLDVALAYVTDCYHNMIGDTLVGIVFVRNVLNVVVSVGIIPWMNSMGLQNTFILASSTAAVILLIPVLLIRWGQKARGNTAAKYERYSLDAIPPASLKKLLAGRG